VESTGELQQIIAQVRDITSVREMMDVRNQDSGDIVVVCDPTEGLSVHLWRLGNVHTGLELKAEGLRNQTEKTGRTKLRVLGGEDPLTS
jgi:urease accessory protein UreE